MNIILSIILMLIMSVEVAMPKGYIPNQPNITPALQQPATVPAWLGNSLPAAPTGTFFSGGGVPNYNKALKPPKWLAFNQQAQSVFDQPMTLTPPNPSGPLPQMTPPKYDPKKKLPAWLQNFLGSGAESKYNLAASALQPQPISYAHPSSTGGNATAAPTSSTLAGNNSMVIGQNQQAYPINPYLNTSTFLAGGGTIARGPEWQFPQLGGMAEQPAYTGFGSQYRGWGGRRGGGGGGGGYNPIPAWYLGLNSWNFNE